MKALSKTAVSLAISTMAAQTAQPLQGLQTRDTNSQSELDRLAIQFRDRLTQLDTLIERTRSTSITNNNFGFKFHTHTVSQATFNVRSQSRHVGNKLI